MISFVTGIQQFAEQGEKTGWSYITIPAKLALQLKPANKKSFRVKGKLDDVSISGVALLPMGGGDFIMALNAAIRKKIKKGRGDKLRVALDIDTKKPELPIDFVECLADEPKAQDFFNTLSGSHRNYFGIWIKSAKTEATRVKRIAQAVTALNRGFDFGQMVRALKAKRQDL